MSDQRQLVLELVELFYWMLVRYIFLDWLFRAKFSRQFSLKCPFFYDLKCRIWLQQTELGFDFIKLLFLPFNTHTHRMFCVGDRDPDHEQGGDDPLEAQHLWLFIYRVFDEHFQHCTLKVLLLFFVSFIYITFACVKI